MNNEYSAENLYKLGSSENKLRTARSDNDIDIITKELRSSESLLSQIVSFEAVYQKNVSDKMKMLNRINVNYGKCNRGIEGFCNELSLEDSSENKLSKKTGFFTKMLSDIIKFFKGIWNFIMGLLKRFKGFINNLFNKNSEFDDNSPPGKDSISENKKESVQIKSTFALDFSRNINTSKFTKYFNDYIEFMKNAAQFDIEISKIFSNRMDTTPEGKKRLMNIILPIVKTGDKLYKIPGFNVKFDVNAGNRYKISDLEKSIANIEKNISFSSDDESSKYKVIEYMTGLKKGPVKKIDNKKTFKTIGDNLKTLTHTVTERLTSMQAPHDFIVEMAEGQLKSINSKLNGLHKYYGDIKLDGIISAITCFYGSVKIATKVESVIANILNEVYKSAMALNIQVNINKADRTMDTRAKLRKEGVKL